MTRFNILPAALAATLVVAMAAPAFAVSIKHSNRAGGDPESQSLPTGHAPPPVDDAPARPLDKSHETGGVR